MVFLDLLFNFADFFCDNLLIPFIFILIPFFAFLFGTYFVDPSFNKIMDYIYENKFEKHIMNILTEKVNQTPEEIINIIYKNNSQNEVFNILSKNYLLFNYTKQDFENLIDKQINYDEWYDIQDNIKDCIPVIEKNMIDWYNNIYNSQDNFSEISDENGFIDECYPNESIEDEEDGEEDESTEDEDDEEEKEYNNNIQNRKLLFKVLHNLNYKQIKKIGGFTNNSLTKNKMITQIMNNENDAYSILYDIMKDI